MTDYDFVFGKMYYYEWSGNYTLLSKAQKQMFALRPQFLKRTEYQHEEEVRFVTCTSARESGGLPLKDIRPETWIKEIRLWPALTTREEGSIVSVVATKLPKVPCERSNLLQPDGVLSPSFEELDMLEAEEDEKRWRTNEDGVPVILKNP